MDTTSSEALAALITQRLAETGQDGIAALFARYVEMTKPVGFGTTAGDLEVAP